MASSTTSEAVDRLAAAEALACGELLEEDVYGEAAHLSLVVDHQAAGHHGEARRNHRACVARMEEIDVETVPVPDAQAQVPTCPLVSEP